jgi:pyruvate dehydrogenase E1 component beta subunit
MARVIKYVEALNEAQDLCMARDPKVFLFGLGVSDPAAIFGSTKNLYQKYGPKRVVDMPVSENAMTGVALGAALAGMRPVMTHIRLEFALLAIDQIVNQAAKWHYMFGGQASVPMVIRLIVGRGWGQGAQHSQSLHSWFAHIPGLKVIMPSTPYDAKGLLISAIEDNNPVLCIEHRWLYNLTGEVPEGIYKIPLTEPHVIQKGTDVTIVASSYSTIEALEAASDLEKEGISCEVIDLRLLNPLNDTKIIESVKKTGNLIAVDMGWRSGGFAAEIVARVVEKAHTALKNPPVRITLPDLPTPTSRALSNYYYPLPHDIANAARSLLGKSPRLSHITPDAFLDIPHLNFTGPF